MKTVNLKATTSGAITAGDPRLVPGPTRRSRGAVTVATIAITDVPDDVDVGAVLARVNSAAMIAPLDGPYEIPWGDLVPGNVIRPSKVVVAINLRLHFATHAAMTRLAAENGRSLNSEIDQACRQHLALAIKDAAK